MVRLLLKNKVNINAVNQGQNSALIFAIWEGMDNVAQLLIENGADVNIVGQDGVTALTLAAKNGKKDVSN